jgi:hypothetical protein
VSTNRDLIRKVMTELSALVDKETNQLVLSGPPTDHGTIETQRGIVLGIRSSMDCVMTTFKAEVANHTAGGD